jgi:hypothetical protein
MNSQVANALSDHPDAADIIDHVPTGKYVIFLFLTGLVAITVMLPQMQVIYYFPLNRSPLYYICTHHNQCASLWQKSFNLLKRSFTVRNTTQQSYSRIINFFSCFSTSKMVI